MYNMTIISHLSWLCTHLHSKCPFFIYQVISDILRYSTPFLKNNSKAIHSIDCVPDLVLSIFLAVSHLTLTLAVWGKCYYYPYFTDKKIDPQSYIAVHSQRTAELWSELINLAMESVLLTALLYSPNAY